MEDSPGAKAPGGKSGEPAFGCEVLRESLRPLQIPGGARTSLGRPDPACRGFLGGGKLLGAALEKQSQAVGCSRGQSLVSVRVPRLPCTACFAAAMRGYVETVAPRQPRGLYWRACFLSPHSTGLMKRFNRQHSGLAAADRRRESRSSAGVQSHGAGHCAPLLLCCNKDLRSAGYSGAVCAPCVRAARSPGRGALAPSPPWHRCSLFALQS